MATINIVAPLSIFIAGELISNLIVFKYINKKFAKPEKSPEAEVRMFWLNISIVKGILERAVLFVGLNFNLITILVAFGAIKIGTRLKDEPKISNDYFLVGNLTSILIAIGYHICFLLITAN